MVYVFVYVYGCRYDDTAGMLVLTCIIVMALSGLFAANISDLVEVLAS